MKIPQLKFPCQKDSTITVPFGVKGKLWRSGKHEGVDIDNIKGSLIFSAYGGIVEHAGKAPKDRPNNKAWGNYISIAHYHEGVNFKTYYCHLDECWSKPGDDVCQAESIGLMGNSGNVYSTHGDGSHLHFGVFVNDGGKWVWVEPKFLDEDI